MTDFVKTSVANGTGIITLDRPRTLNSLSLEMIRALSEVLLAWEHDPAVDAVVLRSSTDKALCAGGDIRYFYDGGKLAMPEVNIGLSPDVGGSYFLSHAPGKLGYYLALTGLTVRAADGLYCGLADTFIPQARMPALYELIETTPGAGLRDAVIAFAAPFKGDIGEAPLAAQRGAIDGHFGGATIEAIMASLAGDDSAFAQKALAAMRKRSPILLKVTLELLNRGASLDLAACLRMERRLVRRNFEHGEVLEGIRALVIDKDNAPVWNPPTLDAVTPEMVARFFESPWPARAHPLRDL